MDLSGDELDYLLGNPFIKYNLLDDETREVWVQECNRLENRKEYGEYNRVCIKLRKNPKNFYEYFKMEISTFDYILENIENAIKKQSNFRECISPSEKLTVTLRYLSTGLSVRSLALSFHMGHCSITSIVKEVTTAIWNELLIKHMPPTNEQSFKHMEIDFLKQWNFPNCIGCIETIDFSSIILHMLVDANNKFIAVDVGDYDSQINNGSLLSGPAFHSFLENYKIHLPETKCLPGEGDETPHVIVGSIAYQLKNYLLRPYSKRNLLPAEELLNNKILNVRKCVDYNLEILAKKWGCLLKISELKSIEKAIAIIKCCCLLHNIIIDLEGMDVSKLTANSPAFKSIASLRARRSRAYNNYSNMAQRVRKAFQNYFVKSEQDSVRKNQEIVSV